jgi:hypothetical protein
VTGIQSLSILGENFSSHHNPTLILFIRSSDLLSMDSVKFVLRCMREELRVMEANTEQRAARFGIDFEDRPVFDSYSDDPDDGPVFDADLDDGPVYDTDADDLDHGSNIAAPVTTIDTSSTCSTKCPHAAVYTELARCGVVGLLPRCKVFTTSCSITGDLGVLFLEDIEVLGHVQGITTAPLEDKLSVAYGRATVDVYEHQCWDPGVLEAPKVTRLWVNFASRAALIWDPGSSRHLQTIMLIRSVAGSAFTSVQGPLILLLMQRKCGGYNWLSLLEMPHLVVPGRDIHGLVLLHAQWQFPIASLLHCSATCQAEAKWVDSLNVNSSKPYNLCADKSPLLDLGSQRIGDIDDNEYIVYQPPEIGYFEWWIFCSALLCNSKAATGHCCFILSEVAVRGKMDEVTDQWCLNLSEAAMLKPWNPHISEFSLGGVMGMVTDIVAMQCIQVMLLIRLFSSIDELISSGCVLPFSQVSYIVLCHVPISVLSQGLQKSEMEKVYSVVWVDELDDRAQHGYHHLTEMISFEEILAVKVFKSISRVESTRYRLGD